MAAAKIARALIVLELLDSVDETRPKRTRGKTRRWIKRREEKGYFVNIVRELRFEDTDSFTEMFRMKFSTMKEILKIIEAEITPHRVMGGHAVISPSEHLALTIRFLATAIFLFFLLSTSSTFTTSCSSILQRKNEANKVFILKKKIEFSRSKQKKVDK